MLADGRGPSVRSSRPLRLGAPYTPPQWACLPRGMCSPLHVNTTARAHLGTCPPRHVFNQAASISFHLTLPTTARVQSGTASISFHLTLAHAHHGACSIRQRPSHSISLVATLGRHAGREGGEECIRKGRVERGRRPVDGRCGGGRGAFIVAVRLLELARLLLEFLLERVAG